LQGRDGERQKPMRLIAAEDFEADGARCLTVDQQVDRASELDPADAYWQGKQLLGAPLHGRILAAQSGRKRVHSPNPSAPTSGTKRHGTEWINAGPSGLLTATSSRWPRALPTGTTSRPRGFSCSYSVCGKPGAAAATAIPSKGAHSGRPSVPSPTWTWTWT